MNKWGLLILIAFISAAVIISCSKKSNTPKREKAAGDLVIGSFNIRNDIFIDAFNGWAFRKQSAIDCIRINDPSIIGLQENEPDQTQDLLDALPEYSVLPSDGFDKLAILYKADEFTTSSSSPVEMVLDGAVFGLIYFMQHKSGQDFIFINVHLSAFSASTRMDQIGEIRKVVERWADWPTEVIVVGDFNQAGVYLGGSLKEDSTLDPTKHDFHGNARAGKNIDKIFFGTDSSWVEKDAWVDTNEYDGRHPSDHFPVFITLKRRSI